MKVNLLSIIQKTLCVLPLAVTLTFGHSLVVSAFERPAEITIQIEISSTIIGSIDGEIATFPVSNAMIVIYVDDVATTAIFTNEDGIAFHSGRSLGTYFARLVQADGYQFENGRKLVGTLSAGNAPVLADLAWSVTPNQPKAQTTLRFVINDSTYTINGRSNVSDTVPFVDPTSNRAMVPLYILEQALGLDVDMATGLIEEAQTITITRGDVNLSLEIGQALPDDMGTPLIIGGRVFVPVTYVAQMLGAHIEWDRDAQAIYLKDSFERPRQREIPRSEELVYITGQAESPQLCALTTLHAIHISEFEYRILTLANAERMQYGLEPLIWSDSLARAASSHSRDMARNDFVCHTGSDGATPGVRAVREGVTGMVFIAENIAAGTRTPERTIEAWMGSEKHRGNILNAHFRYFGVGVYCLDGSEWGVYTTQKFGR